MECGSLWLPAAMRSIASTLIWGMQGWLPRRGAGGGAAGAAARPGGCPSRGGPERIERYGQPGWPVPGLVHHLVDRLVQLEGAQRRLVTARVAPAGLSVALAECRAVALRPAVRRAPQPVRVRVADELCARGVVEGAEHAGDVAQRRGEPPPPLAVRCVRPPHHTRA